MLDSPFLHEWLLAHAAARPSSPAVATPSARLSYAELAGRVRALCAQLAAAGVGRGDRVLSALPNVPAAVAASLAVQALGGTTVEVNREWSADTLAGIAARTGVRHAFVWGADARTWSTIHAARPLERLFVVHGAPLPAQLVAALGGAPVCRVHEDGAPEASAPAAPTPAVAEVGLDHPAVILFTSGSTGEPRGVVQTFRNVNANSRSIARYLELGPEDRALLVLPLYYCYGRSVLQTHLLAGGSIFLDGRFAFPRVVLEALSEEGCTGFAGVPLTFEIIRRKVDVSTLRFPRLRYLTQAGGAMAPGTIDWVREAFHPARLFVMYGQTEATARLSYLPPERAEAKRGSIGVAIPGVELRVVDDAGREVAAGAVGHLVARGDNVTAGYLGDPGATDEIIRDGWLWTGDLAHRDEDGYFFLRGRSREMLKIGGHRVSPTEIEHALAAHPDVAEVGVAGSPDPLLGEVPVAFVVARDGREPSAEALRGFCRARMPAYQVPVRITFVDALPRNEAGKLLRAKLAEQAAAPGA